MSKKQVIASKRNVTKLYLATEEMKWGIKNVKLNRSPGNDGLISEFHHAFATKILKFLFSVKPSVKKSMASFNETGSNNSNNKTK